MKIEYIILKGLLYHDDFVQRALPFIKKEYFPEQKYKIVFGFISEFIEKYRGLPTYEAILIDIGASNISEVDLKDSVALLEELHKSKSEDTDIDWLIDQTEKWIQNRAIYIAIMESVNILDGKNNNKVRGEIPQLLSDAISVSIHNNVGHDYLLNAEDRYDVLHRKEKLVSTGIDILDRVLGGGFPPASLSLFMSNVTGGGKTLTKCHLAASALLQGKNVLYITLEMAEPQIANRIDANLLNIELNTLKTVSKQDFIKKFDNFRNKIVGNLIIKQYPTGSANILHFRSLLNELKLKRGFVPDIVFVDYLNLCASSRIKLGGSTNSYGFMKAVAEEIRGLGMEFDIPFVSSTQSNRCLRLDTIVVEKTKGDIKISELAVDDEILSSGDNFVKVNKIYPQEKQTIYEIRTKSGKVIRCSKNHIFPTVKGLMSLESGLNIGDLLFSI